MKCTFCDSEESETLRDGTIRCTECQTILYDPNENKKKVKPPFETEEVIYERRKVEIDLWKTS